MPEVDMGEFSSVEAALAAIKSNHPRIADYRAPWWGDKDTVSGNMINRGYVIGFRDDASHAQWRLDYDETKKLHINWTHDVTGQETSKECYRISLSASASAPFPAPREDDDSPYRERRTRSWSR